MYEKKAIYIAARKAVPSINTFLFGDFVTGYQGDIENAINKAKTARDRLSPRDPHWKEQDELFTSLSNAASTLHTLTTIKDEQGKLEILTAKNLKAVAELLPLMKAAGVTIPEPAQRQYASIVSAMEELHYKVCSNALEKALTEFGKKHLPDLRALEQQLRDMGKDDNECRNVQERLYQDTVQAA